jgi:thiol-disulfide isomerase/thioredoxin
MVMGPLARGLGALALCAAAISCKDDAAATTPGPVTPATPTPPAAGSGSAAGSAAIPGAGSGAGSAAASGSEPAPTPSPESAPGTWYRAKLVFERVGELPFFLRVPPVGKTGRAYVVNGDETAEFQAEWRDNEISITGPWTYTSLIEAQIKPKTNVLEGTWTRDTPLWGSVVRKFIATPIDKPDPRTRFDPGKPAKPAKQLNVEGTWKFQFASHKEGKGGFHQDEGGVVRGYMKPGQLGDIRFLAGNVSGDKLSLSTFNGNSANLVLAKVSPDGKSMSGLMSMQNVWNEKFTATKVDDYAFVNKVRLKPGKQTVSLKGLDKYKGKPTIAIIFATWCPSCNDAHPFFRDLYAKYHAQGLEILGVDYDLTDDEKANNEVIEQFRVKHKIPWELLQVPCTPETWPKLMPPELEGWDGMPVTMLVRRDGTVHTVFGGWFGPATGTEGEHLRKWFEDSVKELIAAK